MSSRTALVSLAVVVLAFAGCGSSNKSASTSTAASGPPGNTPIPLKRPVRSESYSLNLTGTNGTTGEYPAPLGAPGGSVVAAISINAQKSELCWTFSQLTNVKAPTVVRIYRRAAGPASWRYGFLLIRTYKPSGCVPKPVALLRLIESGPQEWYVSIHSARFPGGAVRAQL